MASKQSERKKFTEATSVGKEQDLQALRDIADDVIESDFVPYACLYDPETIVTKDGELLQTIKITGHGMEAAGNHSLRQAIRNAIRRALPDESYAIWLHTLRRSQARGERPRFPDTFSAQLDEAWQAGQPAAAFFSNELYVTIVKAGTPAPLFRMENLLQTIRPGFSRKVRASELEQMHHELNKVTRSMLTGLQTYGARLLTLAEREGIYYSEQLEFLEKLINLEERPMPVPERDLSHVLTSGEITFGYNAMEVRTADGHRRFAAILTLKEYKESTLAGIDSFLEIPCELIVTQCFSFTGAEEAQEAYAKQARYLSISNDKELGQWMEIDRLMQGAGAREFGQQQTSLFLISASVKQLEANVKMVQRALGRLGIIGVREDLRFEECYWAQLPGNFPFVVRKRPTDTEHLAGFANLQSAPKGAMVGSPWGGAVSLFTTVQDAPYFFNFHRGGVGHSIILGKPGSGRTSFAHFLLAQVRKLPVSIWYLDCHGRAEPFFKAIGGSYGTPGTASLKLNPFHLPDTAANREFLALWLSTLIDPHGHALNRSSLSYFQSLVAQLMQLPHAQRRLSALLPQVTADDPALGATLARFCAGGEYGTLFDMPEDTFRPGTATAWNISAFMDNPLVRIPLTSYLLHRITTSLDGRPTLVVLDEGFAVLDTPLFGPRATGWFDYLTAQNAAAMLMTDAVASSGARAFTSALSQRSATIFAMADADPDAEYAMGFGFSPEEMATLAYNRVAEYHVLQKRGGEAAVLKMDFSKILNEITRQTLSGRVPKAAASPADELAALMGYRTPAA